MVVKPYIQCFETKNDKNNFAHEIWLPWAFLDSFRANKLKKQRNKIRPMRLH